MIEDNNCEHKCENTTGSFYCKCEKDYSLNIDGETCTQGTQVLLLFVDCTIMKWERCQNLYF